jgi:hypothetical protein
MKKTILIGLSIFAVSSMYAQDFVQAAGEVLKAKIEADAKVAIAKKSTIEVNNSKLETTTEMGSENVVVGNTGIVAVGESIKIDNSEITTDTKMGNENVVVGNTGVVLGAH